MANRKAWNHLGMFTREDAVELIGSKMVSQKRRVKMKDGIRIVYYCNVQRSSGCRYEMSVIVPADSTAKVSIDDINEHTCDPNPQKRRRGRPSCVTDLGKPLVKRKNDDDLSMVHNPELSLAFLNHSLSSTTVPDVSASLSPLGVSSLSPPTDGLALFMNQINEQSKMLTNTSSAIIPDSWNVVECEIVDFSKMPDGKYTHIFHAKCTSTYFSHASSMPNASKNSIISAVKKLCFTYGPPHILKFDGSFRDMVLESDMIRLFPNTMIDYHPVRKDGNGDLISRRQPTTVKERIFAWMMESGKKEWAEHLQEIKYNHNMEFVEDIDSTPFERFIKHSIPGRSRMSKDVESELKNENHEVYGECCTEEMINHQPVQHLKFLD